MHEDITGTAYSKTEPEAAPGFHGLHDKLSIFDLPASRGARLLEAVLARRASPADLIVSNTLDPHEIVGEDQVN